MAILSSPYRDFMINSLERMKNKTLKNESTAVALLGKIIRQERKNRNLTQTELGDLCGTSINFISQIEAGKDTAHIGKVLKVLQVLGVQFNIVSGSKGLVNHLQVQS
jgi:y4mF family transcriptional regulator